MTSMFTLCCYVRGDDNSFEVQVERDEIAWALMDIIKKKLSPRFNRLVASELGLRQVSVADSENLSTDVEEYLQSNQIEKFRSGETLSTRVPQESVRGSIHIAVDPPYIQADLSPIQLFCFVKADNHTFQVEIPRDEYVSALRDTVKEKLSPRFDEIPADSLVLRKVSIPYSENISTDVEECFESNQFIPIWGNGFLSDHFEEDPVGGHIHIVVTARPIQTDPSPMQLSCFPMGGHYTFPVRIGRDQSVAALKDIIQERRSPILDKVPLNSLVLRKVSVPDRETAAALRADVGECLQSNQFECLNDTEILSSIFQEDPVKKYIHIVIDYPTRPIRLFGFVEGYPGGVFQVDTRRDISVATLKNIIKEKKSPRLDDIPANLLVLRKVSIPDSVDPHTDVEEWLQSNQFEWLHDTEILSSCFQQEPNETHISIVVTVPSIEDVLFTYVVVGRPSA